MLCACCYIFFIFSAYNKSTSTNNDLIESNKYYFSAAGNDSNDGSLESPFKTITHFNTINLNPGDSVFFKGQETFKGNVNLRSKTFGTEDKAIVITSYGNGNAIINSGSGSAITMTFSSWVSVENITCKGVGRKDGNVKNGIAINNCDNIFIQNIDVSGYQKAGLFIYNSSWVNAKKINAHDNGFAGISVSGETSKNDCHDIYIGYCKADNNPGDPSNFTNHSGNGIIAGFCKSVNIEYCTATNNGWDMPRIGNGPVGIWCYEADSVIIQHCISYKNKTSVGGEDGGGYDLDGGVTNSIIQYCLSYENQGSAFGIFQYKGASNWHDNTIRFCISENDGNVSAAQSNAYIWNSSYDSTQFKNLFFYNNTIYNNIGAAISYSVQSEHSNFNFYNNIFVAANSIITGKEINDVFLANDWWSLQSGFDVKDERNFEDWAIKNKKEQLNGKIIGLNVDPGFKNAGNTTLTDASQLVNFDSYKLMNTSLVSAGIDLPALFNINMGKEDFNGRPLNKNYLGAATQ